MDVFPLEAPANPAVLERISHSALIQIERCPRQWHLSNSQYASFKNSRGTYPQRIWPKTLAGLVVHKSLEAIIKQARHMDGANERIRLYETLKSLGGISDLVKNISNQVLLEVQENPRSAQIRDSLERQMKRSHSEIREDVQSIVSKLKLSSVVTSGNDLGEHSPGGIRGLGDYSEVWVSNDSLGWVGQIDVLRITPEGVEIEDFKSGQSKEDHIAQLHAYAVLWATDEKKNPEKLGVTALRIRYPHNVVDVELPEIERTFQELLNKASKAREKVNVEIPTAYPQEECRFCDVKQICSAYLKNLENVDLVEGNTDVQLTLLSSLPSGMSGDEWVANWKIQSKTIEVRLVLGSHFPALAPNMRIIINSAFVSPREASNSGDDPYPATVICRSNSEVFADI